MKVTNFLVMPLVVISTFAYAQENIDLSAVQKIKNSALTESKVMDYALGLSDLNGPRLSGTPGLKNAMEYAKSELIKAGIKNVRLEPWGTFGRGWQMEKVYVAMTAPYYSPLIAYPKAWTPNTNGLISGEPLFVQIESENDFDKYRGKLSGKIVLRSNEREVIPHFEPDAKRKTDDQLNDMKDHPLLDNAAARPFGNQPSRAAIRELNRKINAFFKSEGVALIIETGTKGDDGTVFVQNGGSYEIGGETGLPNLVMATEHYNRLVRLVKNDRHPKLDVEIKVSFFESDSIGYNLVAEIPGSDKNLKDEIVMLGAHVDSWFASTGATDNASGSAVVMEAMRLLQNTGLAPKRTVRMVLWSSEEQGLFGSNGYVNKNVYDTKNKTKLKDYDKISAYYNLDNGGGKIRGIYAQSNDAVVPIFEQFLKPFNDLAANTVSIRNTGSTDHASFDRVGIPGFQFIQDDMAYGTRTHHSNMDDFDHLVRADLVQSSMVMAGFVYFTANRPEKLPRKVFIPKD